MQAKLADFGGLGVDTGSRDGESFKLSSPELLKGEKPGTPSDVYGANPYIPISLYRSVFQSVNQVAVRFSVL